MQISQLIYHCMLSLTLNNNNKKKNTFWSPIPVMRWLGSLGWLGPPSTLSRHHGDMFSAWTHCAWICKFQSEADRAGTGPSLFKSPSENSVHVKPRTVNKYQGSDEGLQPSRSRAEFQSTYFQAGLTRFPDTHWILNSFRRFGFGFWKVSSVVLVKETVHWLVCFNLALWSSLEFLMCHNNISPWINWRVPLVLTQKNPPRVPRGSSPMAKLKYLFDRSPRPNQRWAL